MVANDPNERAEIGRAGALRRWGRIEEADKLTSEINVRRAIKAVRALPELTAADASRIARAIPRQRPRG